MNNEESGRRVTTTSFEYQGKRLFHGKTGRRICSWLRQQKKAETHE